MIETDKVICPYCGTRLYLIKIGKDIWRRIPDPDQPGCMRCENLSEFKDGSPDDAH